MKRGRFVLLLAVLASMLANSVIGTSAPGWLQAYAVMLAGGLWFAWIKR